MVSNRANELIDAIGDDASFDLVEAFAKPPPFLVICDVMGVPEEQRDWLRRETATLGRAYGPCVAPGHAALPGVTLSLFRRCPACWSCYLVQRPDTRRIST